MQSGVDGVFYSQELDERAAIPPKILLRLKEDIMSI